MALSHMLALLDTPIIHMLLSPLDPAPVLTPSPKDLTQSPRELSMASVRLKLMLMLKLSAPTQLVMQMDMLAIPTQLDMLVIPTLLVMLDTLDIMPMARDLLMLVMLPTPTLLPMAWDTLATPMDLDMLLVLVLAETILELLFHARMVLEVYCFLLKISKMFVFNLPTFTSFVTI